MIYKTIEEPDENTYILAEQYISNICNTEDSYSGKSLLLIEDLFDYKFESIDVYIEYFYSFMDRMINAEDAKKHIDNINGFLISVKTKFNKNFFHNETINDSISAIKKEYKLTDSDERYLIRIHDIAQINANIDIWSCYNNTSELIDTLRLLYKLKIIESKTITFLAIMRTVVIDLLDSLDDCLHGNELQVAELINTIHRISEITYLMRASNLSTEESFVKKIHSICASMQRKKQEKNKYENETILAENAWKIGCNLLHSQMNLLIKHIYKNKDLARLSSKLKKVAPENLVFGKGSKKVISSCPCKLKNECKIGKMLSSNEVIDLPTSKKGVRQPKKIFNPNEVDSYT